jgi:hypothetical protein
MCRLSSNLGASTSWNPLSLSRSVMEYLYLFTYSHLVGWPVLTHITSLPKKEFSVRTVRKSLTKSLPKMLQVNAPKSSCNWFMTGHCAPNAIIDARIWQLLYFLCGVWTTETDRDCPSLSIVTANGLTLSLVKPNKVQNLQVSTASPGTKWYQITFAVFMSLWRVSTLRPNTL